MCLSFERRSFGPFRSYSSVATSGQCYTAVPQPAPGVLSLTAVPWLLISKRQTDFLLELDVQFTPTRTAVLINNVMNTV